MKNFILIFILFFTLSPGTGSGQDSPTDTAAMIAACDSMLELAKVQLSRNEYEENLNLLFNTIEGYRKIGATLQEIESYQRIVFQFLKIRNQKLALKYLRIMQSMEGRIKSRVAIAQIRITQGRFYYETKDYRNALRVYYNALYLLGNKGKSDSRSNIFKSIGDVYVQLNQYGLAEYNYKEALKIYKKEQNMADVAIIYTRIAHCYQVAGNFRKNLEYNYKALKMRELSDNLTLYSSSLLNVGEAYMLLGMNDSARYFIKMAHEYTLQTNNSYYLEVVFRSLRDFALSEGRYKEAYDFEVKRAAYKLEYEKETNRSEIVILEANRSIMENEALSEQIRQKIELQELSIRNRKIQIIALEASIIAFLAILLFLDAMARNNKKRKNELQSLNEKLMQEIRDHQEADQKLKQSEELHRFLAENTIDVISCMDAQLHRTYISKSCEFLFGYTSAEIMGQESPLDLVESSHRATVNQHFLRIFQSKMPVRFTFKALRKDGSCFWAETNINPMLDSGGNVHELISVTRDYSERKIFEEEMNENARQKEYLLREIHNRVKNNFAILGSLITMIRSGTGNAELEHNLADLQLRLRTMSLVHEQLYKHQEINTITFHNYLHTLCQIISGSFSNNKITITTDFEECLLPIELTLPLGLIVNELLTNAYKYAFPGNREGEIRVSLYKAGEYRYKLSIHDNGVGLPVNFSMQKSSTMGTQIIAILMQQLEGELAYKSDGGACFSITFPVNQHISNEKSQS